MPSEAAHISFALRCQNTLVHLCLDPSKHAEWIATVAFYKALHVVEAVFAANKKMHNHDHATRERELKTDRRFKSIFEHYAVLKTASQIARYLADDQTFANYLAPEQVIRLLVDHHLRQLQNSAEQFLTAREARRLQATRA